MSIILILIKIKIHGEYLGGMDVAWLANLISSLHERLEHIGKEGKFDSGCDSTVFCFVGGSYFASLLR